MSVWIGFMWQKFWNLGAVGVVSVSKARGCPMVRSEPASDSSKRDLPLAMSDAGWASGRAVKKGKNVLCYNSWERGVRAQREPSVQPPK